MNANGEGDPLRHLGLSRRARRQESGRVRRQRSSRRYPLRAPGLGNRLRCRAARLRLRMRVRIRYWRRRRRRPAPCEPPAARPPQSSARRGYQPPSAGSWRSNPASRRSKARATHRRRVHPAPVPAAAPQFPARAADSPKVIQHRCLDSAKTEIEGVSAGFGSANRMAFGFP